MRRGLISDPLEQRVPARCQTNTAAAAVVVKAAATPHAPVADGGDWAPAALNHGKTDPDRPDHLRYT